MLGIGGISFLNIENDFPDGCGSFKCDQLYNATKKKYMELFKKAPHGELPRPNKRKRAGACL